MGKIMWAGIPVITENQPFTMVWHLAALLDNSPPQDEPHAKSTA